MPDKLMAKKPSLATVVGTGTVATATPADVPNGASHSITTEHVDKKTGEAYKITKYRDNTSVAGGFTKLGMSGGGGQDSKKNHHRTSPAQRPHQQQRTPSPPSSNMSKPSNLAARRAASQPWAGAGHQLDSGVNTRKPLAPIAINAYPGLLRSELSPASFGSTPRSNGLSPSPTGLTPGRHSPYGAPSPGLVPSPTHVSPHIANAYYEQSAKKGSATYNEDGELEYEEEESSPLPPPPSSSASFGSVSPMLLPNMLPMADPNVEMLLTYQAMLAQPAPVGGASMSNTAALAGAYIRYLEAQANLNRFVNSALGDSNGVAASVATTSPLAQPTTLPPPPPMMDQLSPEIMAALAQQEQVAAQTLKRRAAGVPMAYSASSPVSNTAIDSSPSSVFNSVHRTPASVHLGRNGRGSVFGSSLTSPSATTTTSTTTAAAPISPSTWTSRSSAFGGGAIPSTPFAPFDSHPSRYVLASGSTYAATTPSAISASSSAYPSPLPSPASSTSSLPDYDSMGMHRTQSMQSSDSYTSYASSCSTSTLAKLEAEEMDRHAKMAKYGYRPGSGGAGWGAGSGSDADWSTNWRRRAPLDYADGASTRLARSGTGNQLSPMAGKTEVDRASLSMSAQLSSLSLSLGLGHALDMPTSRQAPGAPLNKSIGLPSLFAEGAEDGKDGGSRARTLTATAAAVATPTLLDHEFVEGLMRTGYSEDEAGSGVEAATGAGAGAGRGALKTGAPRARLHLHNPTSGSGSHSYSPPASASSSSSSAGSASNSPNPGYRYNKNNAGPHVGSGTALGLAGLRTVLHPMVPCDMETPLARDVARF